MYEESLHNYYFSQSFRDTEKKDDRAEVIDIIYFPI